MPATISRLLMCFGVLVAATVIYIPTFIYFEQNVRDESALLIAGVISSIFFATGWILIWRRAIMWTPARVFLTAGMVPGGIVVSWLCFLMMKLITRWSADEVGILIGTFAWSAVWLIGTAIIWRENAKERGDRLRRLGIHAVACPDCGYNLTGLKEAKCPECGATYTLDQLYASITEQRAELGGE